MIADRAFCYESCNLKFYYYFKSASSINEDPEPGRAGDALQRNRYGYCWNNPVRYKDPSGKNEIVVTIQEFLDWMGSGGGAGLTAVEEALVAALGTAVSAAAPYVAITVGVVTLFVVLEDNRPVTVMRAPENQRNLLRELQENGKSFSQPFLRESITSKVLYDPQENKSSVGLDGSLVNLIPETNISMAKNKKKGKDKTKNKTKNKDKTNKGKKENPTSNKGILGNNTYQGENPFKNADFKKNDLKMVDDAANQVGIDRKIFGDYIHEVKQDLGMKANQNFTYQELVKLAKELLKLME